ncbi:MAG: hypothetical protein WBG10_16120 [Pseudolabrys sp.]
MPQAAFKRAFAQERCRVVPKGLREGVANIGAGETDVGEHVAIEARENIGLSAMLARPRQLFEPTGYDRQQGHKCANQRAAGYRQNGEICASHGSLHHSSQGYSAKIASGGAQNHPKSPPESSGSVNIALRGLISETNVFNLIDQKQ